MQNYNLKSKIQIQIKRAQILDLIRDFFKKRGFLEVQTPILIKNVDTAPISNLLRYNFPMTKINIIKGISLPLQNIL